MKSKYFVFCGISFAFSQFVFASGLELTCKADPTALEANELHLYRDKVVTVIIDAAFKKGTADHFSHYLHTRPTKLWCTGSESVPECYGVVYDYNYPRGQRQELEFLQEGDRYKLISYYYYDSDVYRDVFYCEKVS